jgi:hypothetical protein
MTYEEWEKGVPEEIKQDSLWKMKAYRLALFLGDLAGRDAARLAENRHLVSLAAVVSGGWLYQCQPGRGVLQGVRAGPGPVLRVCSGFCQGGPGLVLQIPTPSERPSSGIACVSSPA